MALRYWLMIAGLGSLWGASFALNVYLMRDLGPLSVSLGRVGLGAIFCWGFVFATRKRIMFPKGRTFALLALGATNFAIPFAVYPLAQESLASGVAGIMNGLTPVAVVIISHLWPGGEKASLTKFIGVAFGFLGVYFLAVPTFGADDTSQLWAMVIILLAPISYGVSLNIMRGFRDLDPTILVTWALSAATVMLLPLALFLEGVPVITQTATWVSLFLIGFVSTGFAFIGLYWLVPRVGGTNMSTATFIAPVSAILLGVILFHETLEPAHILGMAAVFVGMLIVDGRILKRFRAATLESSTR